MRKLASVALASLVMMAVGAAQSDNEFSGTWKLNVSKSEIRALPMPPDPIIKLEQKGAVLLVSAAATDSGPFLSWAYPLDSTEAKHRNGASTLSTRTKWEGSALLVNTLVSGPQNYTVMERWKKSRDGSTLTVKRTIVRASGETESLLVYENPAVRPVVAVRNEPEAIVNAPREAGPREPVTKEPAAGREEYVVDAGTRVLLSLVSSVNTKTAGAGDRVYLQTNFPILSKGRIVIPRGSQVAGTVTESQRAGRVKGKASLYLRFDSLTLPNGVTRDFRSRVGTAEAKVDGTEGKMSGEGNKSGDARTVGKTTAAGAGIGSIAGRSPMGAGIGAAAGAAAGVIGVLSSRGADLVLPRGSTMEMVLDRELRFTSSELLSDVR